MLNCLQPTNFSQLQLRPVVKLLSKRWWIPTGARLKGPKLEPSSESRGGVPDPTWGFRAFKALCLAFMAFK